MRATLMLTTLLTLTSGIAGFADRAGTVFDLDQIDAPELIVDTIRAWILPWLHDPTIVAAVRATNERNTGRTLDDVRVLDQRWREAGADASFPRRYRENDAAEFLRRRQRATSGRLAWITVLDRQGAAVALTHAAEQFWTGDSVHFQRAINEGAGAIFIDQAQFNEQAQAYLLEIALPIIDPATDVVIGAATVCIDLGRL